MQQNQNRDRLIELLDTFSFTCLKTCDGKHGGCHSCQIGQIADYLIENGVILPPCKVGDTVYWLKRDPKTYNWYIHQGYVDSIRVFDNTTFFYISPICNFAEIDIGKTVFLSKEDAEKVLKERGSNV